MKCYFHFDSVTGKKILIPGCYGSLNREDKAMCTCDDFPSYEMSDAQYEKQAYNEEVNKLRRAIKELEAENKHLHKENNSLHRIINKITNRR